MKNLLMLILIVGFLSCSDRNDNLLNNSTFEETFSQTEIQDLQHLFDFFNQNICSDIESENLTDCYTNFFKRIETSQDFNIIPIEEQLRAYESISDKTFQDIWIYGEYLHSFEGSQDTIRTVNINLTGKYIEFLRIVGETDNVIKNYYESVEAAGDIPPTLVAELLLEHEKYNINDIRVKFIVAIHYLTLNDRSERKEKI